VYALSVVKFFSYKDLRISVFKKYSSVADLVSVCIVLAVIIINTLALKH